MATTVNGAFAEFLKGKENLDFEIVFAARDSRDSLLDNISEFDNQDGFFDLCENFNLHYGSFARKKVSRIRRYFKEIQGGSRKAEQI